MKKILIAFDGLNYSPSLTEYAIDLARQTDSMLAAVFIYDLRYMHLIYTYTWEVPGQFVHDINQIEKDDDDKIKVNIKAFASACEKANIHHKVHLDSGVPLMELLKESAFADLILIDAKTSFFEVGEKTPSTFLKDLLTESKCPVIIVPENPTNLKNVVISYDGSDSSIYAMKMFSYLFPEWNEKNTTLVSVNKTSTNHVPGARNIKDLAQQHFKKVNYEILHGDAGKELIGFLKKNKENTMVVMGSYGRSALSRMFHQSISNKVISDLKIPVFITHQ